MRTRLAICLLLATWFAPKALHAQKADSASPLTLTQYVAALDDSLTALREARGHPEKAADVLSTLPSSWQVEADGRKFEVSTQSLRRDLTAWQAKPTDDSLNLIEQHLETLRYEAVSYESGAADVSSRRAVLNSILARSEFSNVHGQSWMDRFKERVRQLLLRWLGKVISSSAIPIISDILVYGLIVMAVLVIAYWMYRSFRDGARLETIMPVSVPVSAKEWPLWLAEARAAAAKNDWRNAVHLAYWAGISFLEAQGAWHPDQARTPREYLRLLSGSSALHPALRALTMRLEGVWYGMQVAEADSFEQTLADLERLGCPCN